MQQAGGLQLSGSRTTGEDVRTQNGVHSSAPALARLTRPPVNACTAVANIVKSSLGPVGLDKARSAAGQLGGGCRARSRGGRLLPTGRQGVGRSPAAAALTRARRADVG